MEKDTPDTATKKEKRGLMDIIIIHIIPVLPAVLLITVSLYGIIFNIGINELKTIPELALFLSNRLTFIIGLLWLLSEINKQILFLEINKVILKNEIQFGELKLFMLNLESKKSDMEPKNNIKD